MPGRRLLSPSEVPQRYVGIGEIYESAKGIKARKTCFAHFQNKRGVKLHRGNTIIPERLAAPYLAKLARIKELRAGGSMTRKELLNTLKGGPNRNVVARHMRNGSLAYNRILGDVYIPPKAANEYKEKWSGYSALKKKSVSLTRVSKMLKKAGITPYSPDSLRGINLKQELGPDGVWYIPKSNLRKLLTKGPTAFPKLKKKVVSHRSRFKALVGNRVGNRGLMAIQGMPNPETLYRRAQRYRLRNKGKWPSWAKWDKKNQQVIYDPKGVREIMNDKANSVGITKIAQKLLVDPDTARNMAKSGELPAKRVDGAFLVPKKEFVKMLPDLQKQFLGNPVWRRWLIVRDSTGRFEDRLDDPHTLRTLARTYREELRKVSAGQPLSKWQRGMDTRYNWLVTRLNEVEELK